MKGSPNGMRLYSRSGNRISEFSYGTFKDGTIGSNVVHSEQVFSEPNENPGKIGKRKKIYQIRYCKEIDNQTPMKSGAPGRYTSVRTRTGNPQVVQQSQIEEIDEENGNDSNDDGGPQYAPFEAAKGGDHFMANVYENIIDGPENDDTQASPNKETMKASVTIDNSSQPNHIITEPEKPAKLPVKSNLQSAMKQKSNKGVSENPQNQGRGRKTTPKKRQSL